MNTSPSRLFFGIWPDEASRQRLAAWQRSVAWPAGARCTPEQDLHLTLHFIGDVPAKTLQALIDDSDLPAPLPLGFDIDQTLVWPGGLVVLTARVVPPALTSLHQAIAAVLIKHGVRVETRPYAPHVTMARKAGGRWTERLALEPIPWVSRGYRLAARSGAHYAAVASFESS